MPSKHTNRHVEYSTRGYIDKVNPEFANISAKHRQEKQQSTQIHSFRTKLDNQLKYFEKKNHELEKNLKKKQLELKRIERKNTEHLQNLAVKERMERRKEDRYNQIKSKTMSLRDLNRSNTLAAKETLFSDRKSLANTNKMKSQELRKMKTMKEARQWDLNKHKVSSIEQAKKKAKESLDKHFQKNNMKSMKSYQLKIDQKKREKEKDQLEVVKTEDRLIKLRSMSSKKSLKLEKLDNSIANIRKATNESFIQRSRVSFSSENNLKKHEFKGQSLDR